MEWARQRQLDHPQSMVGVFPVNLEYLQWIDFKDPIQRQIVNRTIDQQLRHLDSSHKLILGTVLWEYNTDPCVRMYLRHFEQQCQKFGTPVHFLLGLEKKSLLSDRDNCTFIDFSLLRTHYHCRGLDQQLNQEWRATNKKFLFLMGKSLKPHRIGLLHRFYKQGLLTIDKCIWSFYDNVSVEAIKEYAPDATPAEIQDLLDNYRHSPDQTAPSNNHYGGFPFDSGLYENTNLSVVSETIISTPFNSEKIYRAMINHHPFVIAGAMGHSDFLSNMGFEPYDQFFAVPDYDLITNLNHRLDAVVTNVKNFQPVSQIQDLIEQNFQRLHQLVKYYVDSIDQVFGTDTWQEYLLKETHTPHSSWQYHYQSIKDPSWPECGSIEDCANLPDWMQKELRTVFKLHW